MSLKAGTWLGQRYHILRPLGSGSEGSVYLALQENIYRFYAVKELPREGSFYSVQSLTLWKRLAHPGLPQIVDVLEEEQSVFLVMEYVEGQTLTEYLEKHGIPAERTVCLWAIQICEILAYLHGQEPPIIFGDLKPGNIILNGGRIVLVDLGSAVQRSYRGQVTGTRGYFPLWKTEPDEECDLYALGRTMEMLLGGGTLGTADEERISVRVRAVISRCVRQDALRYDSAAVCRRDLLRLTRRRWKLCTGFLCAACAIWLAGRLIVGEQRTSDAARVYEQTLRQAEKAEEERRLVLYRAAIAQQPEQEQGYCALLSYFLEDAVLTRAEEAELREALREKGEEAARLAYEVGLAYWYFYEESGREQLAVPWFAQVLESPEGTVTAAERARSRIYQSIGSYRIRLEQGVQTGENVAFGQYWADLTALFETEAEQTENPVVTLALWREMEAQMTYYALEFKHAGVTRREMEEVQKCIEQKLGRVEEESAAVRSMKHEIEETDRLLTEAVERTYQEEDR